MADLTKKQRVVLETIAKAIEEKGYVPAVREICSSIGLSSPSTVQVHLNSLEERGFIHRDAQKSRSITLTAKGREELGISEKPSIKGNEAQVLKTLRALQRVRTFTDIQDATIKKLIKAYEEGVVAKAYSSNIVKELKTVEDPIEKYFVIVNNIPDAVLKPKKEQNVRHEGVTEIILSDYLIPGEK